MKNSELSRRERQIMDVIYQRGQATVAEVRTGLPAAPSYSAVRALLAILVTKGFLKIITAGHRYVYLPTRSREEAGRSALRRVVETFFGDSIESAVAALLSSREMKPTSAETARLKSLIDQSRKGGR